MPVAKGLVAAVFILEIVAFGLAIGAESRRHHVTTTIEGGVTYCRYHKDAATAMGIVGFLFLLLGQLLVTGLTKCMCCSSPLRPGAARVMAIILFVLSWFSFVIAEMSFLAGSIRAAYRVRTYDDGSFADCKALRRGIFSAAAAFTFFTLLLGEGYYLCFARAQEKNWYLAGAAPYHPGGVAPYHPGGAAPYHPGDAAAPYNAAGSYNPGGAPYNAGAGSIGMSAFPARA